MKKLRIAISGYGSVSPLGVNRSAIWQRYQDDRHCFIQKTFPFGSHWIAPVEESGENILQALSQETSNYSRLDRSVCLAICAARLAIKDAKWENEKHIGVNIGSSRGATILLEKYLDDFIQSDYQSVSHLSSPYTTLGNIAGWVAGDLRLKDLAFSHSITCSTALHAIANGIAWITSGMSSRFLVGGSEAALTAFSIAQMKALKVYSTEQSSFPCHAMKDNKHQNTMILGEGAAMFCLEDESDHALAYITGLGYGTEPIQHGTWISDQGICLQKAMNKALEGHDPTGIDAIVLHAPGTIKGDTSEKEAIKAVFGHHRPLLTSNKWKIGHSLGASGALSMEMALLMLKYQQFIAPPYLTTSGFASKELKKILINATGFGGNAVSLIIEK